MCYGNRVYITCVKQLFDITVCIFILPFLGLIFLVVSVLIKLEDRGPVLYSAERIGKNFKIFRMHKFRTMKPGAQKIHTPDRSTYVAEDDPRLTRIGKFLREWSIDETPQIFNVLRGEMSLIGPRASLAGALNSYKPDEVDKMKVKPGITGHTQAYYRNTITNREKRLNDAWYANNVSFWLDLKILIRTISRVIKREGLYTNAPKSNIGQSSKTN